MKKSPSRNQGRNRVLDSGELNHRQRAVLRWLRKIGKAADGLGVTNEGMAESVAAGLIELQEGAKVCSVDESEAGKAIPDSSL